MISIGIDIGGTSIKVAVLDGARPLWLGASQAYQRPGPGEVVAALRSALSGGPFAGLAAAADDKAVGTEVCPQGVPVGLCVPGVLDEQGTTIVRSTNLPGLAGVGLVDLLRSAMPASGFAGPLRTFSDAHAAGVDFARARAIRGRLLAISLGTGVGAAVLDDSGLLRVSGGSSGHFGQMDVTVAGLAPVPIGPDGGVGGLEGYIGLPALLARHGDVRSWLARLNGGEPELAALARAIRIGHAIYRPHHVALLGGIGIRLAPVLEPIRRMVATGLTTLARDGWTMTCGESDHHAAQGAAWLAGQALS